MTNQDIIDINKKIKDYICYDTINKLKDENLIEDYKSCKSVKKSIQLLKSILENNEIEEEKIENILSQYIVNLIPPGTKGVVRGNKFNKIIKENILEMKLNEEKFEIKFEQFPSNLIINDLEIPDFYIKNKKTCKIIIGMNQMDLWRGGAQSNRGSKYIFGTSFNSEKQKLLCVVCNEIQFTEKNKIYKLIKEGFDKNTLCYIKNLKTIIKNLFML